MLNYPGNNKQYFPNELIVIAPMLALSTTLTTSLVMGIIFILVLIITACCVSLLRNFILSSLRIPIIFIIAATVITIIELVMGAGFYELKLKMGIYLPLIAVNTLLLSIAEEHFLRLPAKASLIIAFRISITITVLAVVLGLSREIMANGTLLTDFNMIVELDDFSGYRIFDPVLGLTLAGKPAGALIILGLVAGCINHFYPAFLTLPEPGS